MPSGPPAPESYSHLLDAQKQAAEKAATSAGQTFDSRGQAAANIASRFDDPADALSYLAGVSTSLETEKKDLLDKQAGGTSLGADEKNRLTNISRELAGTQSIGPDVLRGISGAQADRIRQYHGQDVGALKVTVDSISFAKDQADRALAAAEASYSTDPNKDEKLKPYQEVVRVTDARMREANTVFLEKQRLAGEQEARARAGAAATDAVTEQGRADARRTQLRSMPIDALEGSVDDLRDASSRLEAQYLSAAAIDPASEQTKSLKSEWDKTKERFDEANTIYGKKLAAGEIGQGKQVEAEREEQLRKNLLSGELQRRVDNEQLDARGLDLQIRDLDDDIRNEADPVRKRQFERDRANLITRSVELGKKLSLDQAALKEARTKEGVELTEVLGIGDVRKMSNTEYLALSPKDKVKYLQEVAAVAEIPSNFGAIRDAMEQGQPVSVDEMAIFVKRISQSITDRGRRGYDFRHLYRIQGQHPEVYQAIVEKVLESRQARTSLEEAFPRMRDRILGFARNHPHWMLILLAIAAGSVIGPTTMVTSAVNFAQR